MNTLQILWKSAARTTVRLGVFLLLALPFSLCQTGNSAPPTDAKRTAAAAKKASDDKKTAAEKKAADDKAAAEKKAAEEKKQADALQASRNATTTEKPLHVLVMAVASDQLSLDVTTAGSTRCDVNAVCNVMHLMVTDNLVKDQLKQLHKGDHIQIVYSTEIKNTSTVKNSADINNSADTKKPPDTKTQYILKAWCVDSLPTPFLSRLWLLAASAGVCFLMTLIFSGFHPLQLIISEDNRYSNSRFQMAVWFFVLISTYIATLELRIWWAGWDFIGGVDIPKNLLLLSGMSALTFGGAKAITASKVAAAGAALKPPAPAPNFFNDLTHNDLGQFDFGDFQMLIITLIAVGTYIVLVLNFFGTVEYSKVVSLPDVDTTLLATFGLGQGAYLTKKAVGGVSTS